MSKNIKFKHEMEDKYFTLKGVDGPVRPVDGRDYGELGKDAGFVHLIKKGGVFSQYLFCGILYFEENAVLLEKKGL